MTEYPSEHVPADEFVALAEAVLEKVGDDYYEDDLLRIRRHYNGLSLEIQRTAQPVEEGSRFAHLRVSNPTTMVAEDGDIIRHHGEHCYLTPRMRAILAS